MKYADKDHTHNIIIIVGILCFIALSVGVSVNEYRIKGLQKQVWTEWDNKNSLDECCLNGNELICPKGFMKVAVFFINGSEIKLDYSSFKLCNTHTSFAISEKSRMNNTLTEAMIHSSKMLEYKIDIVFYGLLIELGLIAVLLLIDMIINKRDANCVEEEQ